MPEWRMVFRLERPGELGLTVAVGPYLAPNRVSAFHAGLQVLCDRLTHEQVSRELIHADLFEEEEFHDDDGD